MQWITQFMNKNDVTAASGAARDYTTFQKRGAKKLHFVYDLIGCDSAFDSLRFVLDAVRPPKTSAHFEKDFNLPRFLTFEKHSERQPVAVDFWCGIYD